MRLDTGPVCMTLQAEPKTTPRPMPREASRIRERRTQLAPAVVPVGGARRWRLYGGVAFGRVCVVRASAPRRSNVQAGGIAEPQHFGSACVRARRRRKMSSKCKLGQEVLFLPRRDGGTQFSFARW